MFCQKILNKTKFKLKINSNFSEAIEDLQLSTYKGLDDSAIVIGYYCGEKILKITESGFKDYKTNELIANIDAVKKFINIVKINFVLNLKGKKNDTY